MAVVMAFGVEAMLPAFDEIDAVFGFSDQGISVSLLVTSLLVGMGAGQLVWGPMSDSYGRRPVLCAGLALYAIGALGTALAPNVELLLLARVVWGLGAAAPNGLRFAVVRDLFDGDRMARIVTIGTALFLIGPVVMPVVGEGILTFADWRMIAIAGFGLAALAVIVAVIFGETLPPDARRPLRVGDLADGAVEIMRTPASVGAVASAMFFAAAFFIYLGSAQPIIDRIYGREDQFIWFFGASGISMSIALVINDRLIKRFGSKAVVTAAARLFLAVDLMGLLLTVAADGVPSIWVWITWACAANAAGILVSSICAALALDPMGRIAGTAGSILAFAQLAPGSALAALVDSRIDSTVTPMLVGSLLYGILGYACLQWSLRRGGPAPVHEVAVPVS
jgi:DHA1 family bicyclomycin/chloramphenicol resistance-like MFS transporter